MKHFYCIKLIGQDVYFDIQPDPNNPEESVVVKVDWPVLFELVGYAQRVHRNVLKIQPDAKLVSAMVTIVEHVIHH